MASMGTEHKSGSLAKRGLVLLAVVLMVVCLAWAGIALAAPRSSGSLTTTTDESASAESSSATGLYTRSDIPRPSGDYSSWFAVEEEEPAATTTTKLPEIETPATTASDTDSAADDEDDWWSPDMDCSTCHDIDALAEETADSTVLTDINGTVVNPHDLPDISNHSSITCSNCHKNHDDSTLEKWSMRTCESCHHADVWECYTCHS